LYVLFVLEVFINGSFLIEKLMVAVEDDRFRSMTNSLTADH